MNKWIVVALLWIVTCLNYMDRMTIFTIFPVLQREMGISNVALAMLGSVFLWAYGISSPLCGYLGDRFNRKRVILWSLVIFSGVTFGTGLAQTHAQLIALRVFLGLSEALFLPAALAHVAAFHTDSTRSLANAAILTGLPAGAGLGGFYGGFMAEHLSWRASFYLLGVLGLALALVLLLWLPDKDSASRDALTAERNKPAQESLARNLLGVFQNRTSICLIFLAFALSLTSWPTASWMPTYFYERFGMSLTQSGFYLAMFTYIPALAGSIAGGVWADRWTRSNARGRILVQVIGLSFMAPTMLATGFIPSVGELSASLLVYSVARGMLEVNSMPIFSSVMPSDKWATAYGLYNFAGTMAGSLGILAIGYLKSSWGIGRSLSLMSVALFCALVVMALAPLHITSKSNPEGNTL
ncbi:MAG TPA: MFS transporter [Edaphobacter sp.]|nr:MFS transporter [Edaphobacter sp.]